MNDLVFFSVQWPGIVSGLLDAVFDTSVTDAVSILVAGSSVSPAGLSGIPHELPAAARNRNSSGLPAARTSELPKSQFGESRSK
jgi:hypothetical protein